MSAARLTAVPRWVDSIASGLRRRGYGLSKPRTRGRATPPPGPKAGQRPTELRTRGASNTPAARYSEGETPSCFLKTRVK